MDFGFPVFQRTRTMQAYSFHSSFSDGFSHGKQSEIVEIHSAEQWRSCFNAFKENNKLLVIEFTATWCGPCRSMEPFMKELAAMYTDVQFIKIDVDKVPCVGMQFNMDTVMPSFVLVKKGKEVEKVSGCRNSELQNKIEKHRLGWSYY